MSNFWGYFFHVFRSKFFLNILASALKSCIKWRWGNQKKILQDLVINSKKTKFRGITGYLKLGWQVVMRRAAAVRRRLLYGPKVGGQLPILPTDLLRPWMGLSLKNSYLEECHPDPCRNYEESIVRHNKRYIHETHSFCLDILQLKKITVLNLDTIYRTRAIISRGLYIFYPIFHCGLPFIL